MLSNARAWFLRVFSNSSSYTGISHKYYDSYLLLESLLNLGSNLADFDLGTESLRLFSLEGCFCIVQSCLEFLFLDLEASAEFLEIVNALSSFSQLVGDVLQLLSQSLVLSTDGFDLFASLIKLAAKTEGLSGSGTGVSLGAFEVLKRLIFFLHAMLIT